MLTTVILVVKADEGSVDFTNAILSDDGTKECINKTLLVKSVEKER